MSTKQQLEYIKKAYDNTITLQDIKNYLKLVVQDNKFKIKNMPKLTFKSQNSGFGGYRKANECSEAIINIDIQRYFDLMQAKKESIVGVLYTLGHELRHHLQFEEEFDNILFSGSNQHCCNQIKQNIKNGYELKSFHKTFLSSIEENKDNIPQIIEECSKIPNFIKWISNFSNKELQNIKQIIENSYYLNDISENDAIIGGVLFTKLILNDYKRITTKQNEPIFNYLEDLTAETQGIELKHLFAKYKFSYYWHNFKDFTDNISVEDVNTIKHIKQQSNNKKTEPFYTSLFIFSKIATIGKKTEIKSQEPESQMQ